jgi:hypothetical protein
MDILVGGATNLQQIQMYVVPLPDLQPRLLQYRVTQLPEIVTFSTLYAFDCKKSVILGMIWCQNLNTFLLQKKQ